MKVAGNAVNASVPAQEKKVHNHRLRKNRITISSAFIPRPYGGAV